MARGRKPSGSACPSCGRVCEPAKTWSLVSPLPDAEGRVTVTVMGLFTCPSCGTKWRGVVSKLKVGGAGVEVSGRGGRKLETQQAQERQGEVIEIELEEIFKESS